MRDDLGVELVGRRTWSTLIKTHFRLGRYCPEDFHLSSARFEWSDANHSLHTAPVIGNGHGGLSCQVVALMYGVISDENLLVGICTPPMAQQLPKQWLPVCDAIHAAMILLATSLHESVSLDPSCLYLQDLTFLVVFLSTQAVTLWIWWATMTFQKSGPASTRRRWSSLWTRSTAWVLCIATSSPTTCFLTEKATSSWLILALVWRWMRCVSWSTSSLCLFDFLCLVISKHRSYSS